MPKPSPLKFLAWCLVGIFAGSYLFSGLVDPDLWWHITAGRWMLAEGQIATADHWNLFGHGQPWRAYSWSNELLVAWIELHFGVLGLVYLKMLLASLLGLCLGFAFSVLARDYAFGALLGVYATVGTVEHFTLRPQAFVWILFALLIVSSERFARGKRAALLEIAVLMCLWANSHLSTILGVGLAVLWVAGSVAQARLRLAAQAGIVALLATFITPYLGAEWLTFFAKADHPFVHSSIAEFQPAAINQYSTALLVLILVMLALLLHRRPRGLHTLQVLLLGGFTLGALAVVKFVPFAIILACASLAKFWSATKDERAAAVATADTSDGLLLGLSKLCELLGQLVSTKVRALGLSAVLLLLVLANSLPARREPVNRTHVAVEAMNFFQKHALPHPLLNAFGDGGYVMYRFSDTQGKAAHLVPVDGRTNVTPADVLEKHHFAFQGSLRWREYLDAMPEKPRSILWRAASPLAAILVASADWCLLYQSPVEAGGHVLLVERSWWEQAQQAGQALESKNCK